MMDLHTQADLETRLHDLLCGDLDEPQKREVLGLIARDDAARRVLGDLLRFQSLSRAAFGYDRAEASLEAGLARFKESRRPALPADLPPARRPADRRRAKSLFTLRWVVGLSAAAVVVTCLCLAIFTRWENRFIREQLVELGQNERVITDQLTQITQQTISAIQVTPADLAEYRELWRETASADENGQPWILVRNGVGRFEYLPDGDTKGPTELVLLRCTVVSVSGVVLEEMNLLLPKDRTVQVSFDTSKRLGGRPIRCQVASDRQWVGMGLQVGQEGTESVGVQGRVALGNNPSEIGQFRLDQHDYRVILHAMPLAATVG
jgi:hypothetical protein